MMNLHLSHFQSSHNVNNNSSYSKENILKQIRVWITALFHNRLYNTFHTLHFLTNRKKNLIKE